MNILETNITMLSRFNEATNDLKKIFDSSNVDAGHGINHALEVTKLGLFGIILSDLDLTDHQSMSIMLACLLHDADDRKFFPNSKNYENARQILNLHFPDLEDLVIELISKVSCSKNGNSTDGLTLPEEEWMLYPRYADRCEALGEIGIFRCWTYNMHDNRLLFDDKTPRVKSLSELEKIATPERFQRYTDLGGKVGGTMMDHYYDKLFQLIIHPNNYFFNREITKRGEPIVKFIMDFGESGEVDLNYLKSLEKKFTS